MISYTLWIHVEQLRIQISSIYLFFSLKKETREKISFAP